MKKIQNLAHKKPWLIFMLVFAVIGTITLLLSHAATSDNFFEVEGGTLSARAVIGADATASKGQYVKFSQGASTCPAGQTGTPPNCVTPPTGGTWKPLPPGQTWQWQLTGTVNETVLDGKTGPRMIDIDLENASAALVGRFKAKGIYVVCYMESGDWNKGRADSGDFAPAILGKTLDGFPDEKFINVNAMDSPAGPTGKTLRQIMTARIASAKAKGCDGIEPDLDDLHTYTTGFTITKADQVAHNKALIDIAHSMGMSMGLKNGASASTGASSFEKMMLDAGADWALNEECNQFSECDGYKQFVAAGKAVFQVEYQDNQKKPYATTCQLNNTNNFDGIVKDSSSKLSALPLIACR